MKYVYFNLPIGEMVPEEYKLIEAYAKGDDIVVPISSIPEEQEELHNCDWEGCGTLSHVVRFNVQRKYNIPKEKKVGSAWVIVDKDNNPVEIDDTKDHVIASFLASCSNINHTAKWRDYESKGYRAKKVILIEEDANQLQSVINMARAALEAGEEGE
ncbi:MAG: hypothetical protein SVK08_02415 [Halobacteriota archaeon]|nr:hypothetical protein [Halobacteriota archaeon]